MHFLFRQIFQKHDFGVEQKLRVHSFIEQDNYYYYLFLFIYYACSITISNTTCFVGLQSYMFSKIAYLLYTPVNVSFACYFIFYEFSSCMLSTNLLKIFVVFVNKSIFAYGPVFCP